MKCLCGYDEHEDCWDRMDEGLDWEFKVINLADPNYLHMFMCPVCGALKIDLDNK